MTRRGQQAGRLRVAAVWTVALWATLTGAWSFAAVSADQEPEPATREERRVVAIRVDSIIHPVAAEFVRESLEIAEDLEVDAFVIELATPGGLLTSTREIFTDMLGAKVPVVVYVSPSGSQAASAGFFLLMAADVAAMAPGTNTGAAHPVAGSGEEITGVMADKVEEDAAATIRSLADRNNRNLDLAESAVIESKSFTAEEALANGLIDLIAADLPSLLSEIDGREIRRGEATITLATSGASIERREMSAFQRLLSAIAHPNIAYILMTLGGLGLYFELSNPGAVLPGVVGAICLILAFFALSVLPVNYAGVALILLAMIFFIAEVKVVSYGLLTVGGLIALVLGSLMLFKSADPAIRVGLDVIMAAVLFSVLVVGFMTTMAVRAHRSPVRTGSEGLINEHGVARSEVSARGKVFVHGEIWDATSDVPIGAGGEIVVVGVDGLTLRVRPSAAGAAIAEPEELL